MSSSPRPGPQEPLDDSKISDGVIVGAELPSAGNGFSDEFSLTHDRQDSSLEHRSFADVSFDHRREQCGSSVESTFEGSEGSGSPQTFHRQRVSKTAEHP